MGDQHAPGAWRPFTSCYWEDDSIPHAHSHHSASRGMGDRESIQDEAGCLRRRPGRPIGTGRWLRPGSHIGQ